MREEFSVANCSKIWQCFGKALKFHRKQGLIIGNPEQLQFLVARAINLFLKFINFGPKGTYEIITYVTSYATIIIKICCSHFSLLIGIDFFSALGSFMLIMWICKLLNIISFYMPATKNRDWPVSPNNIKYVEEV